MLFGRSNILLMSMIFAVQVGVAWGVFPPPALSAADESLTFRVVLRAGDLGRLSDAQGNLHAEIVQQVPYGGAIAPVTAVPAAHCHFTGWVGDVSGTAPTLTLEPVTENVSAVAGFERDIYVLRFSGGDRGKVEVDGTLYEVYEQAVPWGGSAAAVTARPNDPAMFRGWSGPDGFATGDSAIRVTNVQSGGNYTYALPTLAGCGIHPKPKTYTDAEGFHLEDFQTLNVHVDGGHLMLKTGDRAIDPERIVLPFRQEVAVYFLYEGAGCESTDFGWMLADTDPQTGKPTAPRQVVYRDITDHNHAWNSGNGVLDATPANTADRFGDRNGDGRVDALDNREVIGTFAAGTEIVFYLESEEARYDPNHDFGRADEPVYLYTKTAWNRGAYRSDPGDPAASCDRALTGRNFIKTYRLGQVTADEGRCILDGAWMSAEARNRAAELFGLRFAAEDVSTLSISWDERFPAVMAGAPDDKPNAWLLGWEENPAGGDTDHNDLMFIIERKSGGTAQSRAPLTPVEPEAYFTAAEFQVCDYQPGGFCQGKTTLHYYLSPKYGAAGSWIKIGDWDRIHAVEQDADGNRTILEPPLTRKDWQPGSPEHTFRSRRIDLAALGIAGRGLVWKVEMISEHESCTPRVIDATLRGDTATRGRFSRASPVVQANLVYGVEYETPDEDWTEAEYRGHVTASRIYAPDDPDRTLVGDTTVWDAGAVLAPEDPDARVRRIENRTIYFPDLTVTGIAAEALSDAEGILLTGDGARRSFQGKLQHRPVMATTLRIYDHAETFTDAFSDVLAGSLNGRGTIDRFAGEWKVTFQQPPSENMPLYADYSYYETSGRLREFTPDNVTNAMLGLSDARVHPNGYVYDFNGDGKFDEADGDWLVRWVRGYKDPDRRQARRWLLGPVDHSTPALMIPPGYPLWFFGSEVGSAEQESYLEFRKAHQDRPAVLFVGSRSGMLHAFDAGTFRHGDNPVTVGIEENRGYFEWREMTDERPEYCRNDDLHENLCPDYGTGEELWALIPANLLPRLKNNRLRADDRAYVDASPALVDAYIDTDGDDAADAWRTLLLSAEGNGGDTVFCLDVTDPHSPRFLWEFASPELFRSRSSPATCQIGRIQGADGARWAAFFVTGNAAQPGRYPAVYMVDVANGHLLRRIALDSAVDRNQNGFFEADEREYGQGGIPSGPAALVDTDANGYVDRFYVATDRGIVYKVNIPDQPNLSQTARQDGITVCDAAFNQDFNDDGLEISQHRRWQPIHGSPAVMVDHQVADDGTIIHPVRLFFGTADSPYYEENIDSAETRYHFFAYLDTAAKGSCRPEDHKLDWFIELPPGHRVFASAFAAAGRVYFGTATAETEDPCEGHLEPDADAGRVYGLDLDGTILLQQPVGNVRVSPLVEDRHLYYRTVEGLHSLGAGRYNNRVLTRAEPRFRIHAWEQVD